MKTNASTKPKRMYSIYDLTNGGQLLAALPWKDAKDIYATRDDLYLAVYLNRKGKSWVRWLSTGLEASARERLDALWRLKTVRGEKPLNLPTR
jgi:hypothetical protein